MNKLKLIVFLISSFSIFFLMNSMIISAERNSPIVINTDSQKIDVYDATNIIKFTDDPYSIDEIVSLELSDRFQPIRQIEQKTGFFKRVNWLYFEVTNESFEDDWLLEIAFPLIHELEFYSIENGKIIPQYIGGADVPFYDRPLDHRNFIFNLNIEPGETKTYYIKAVGSGDLHPPINIWNKDNFIEKSQLEFLLLGSFYGIIIVMIFYNLFLFFSLRIRSYIYYVFVMVFSLLGKLSINGLGFQLLWPNYPDWNRISTIWWVALACIFVVIFSRNFLDINKYIPFYNKIFYSLITLNLFVILSLFISRYLALSMMVFAALITFYLSLTVAIICLVKGAREARFYIVGWLVFLTGVSITLLERAVYLPYNMFTEYAGQAALTIEVVLLSLALADKIKIIRREKEEAERKARDSQKLAIENLKKADQLKDEFLAIASHELRTPLYGMIGIAESLRDGITGKISKNMHQQLSMIISSGKRLTQLVNEILDFSKIKYDSIDLETKPVHISTVLNIVLAITKPLLKDKPIAIINRIDDSIPLVLADQNRLQQVFYNLIDNAIKYTDSGSITIYTTYSDHDVTIHIEDTGRGISTTDLESIFQPFKQSEHSLSRDTSGVGIGLSITKSLVELQKGKLDVTSKLGEGSKFSVTLPIHEPSSEEEIHAIDESQLFYETTELIQIPERTDFNRPVILVADDEIVNLQVLVNQLTLEGYEVLTAQNGEDVLHLLEVQHIDLLILDIMMPGMSGYDVCRKLRKDYSLMELPVLMLTAKNQLHDKMLAFEAGANDYLVKPCDRKELLSRVKTLARVKLLNEEIINMNVQLEEKVLERTKELKIANEHLHELTESRRQMLANIAHELGTPVTLVHNYIQSLQQGIIESNDLHYGNLVMDKINVLKRLIEDLYDLSLLEAGKISFNLERREITSWLEQVMDKCMLTVEDENRSFIAHPIPKQFAHLSSLIDEDRMDQLFSNLISNAIKNTDEQSGEISISAKYLDDQRFMIQVSDNGFGIEKENLPYIFDRFYKSDRKYQIGTGLGLAIVKQIVQHHQGKIWVESEINEGTIFYIILPFEVSLVEEEKKILTSS